MATSSNIDNFSLDFEDCEEFETDIVEDEALEDIDKCTETDDESLLVFEEEEAAEFAIGTDTSRPAGSTRSNHANIACLGYNAGTNTRNIESAASDSVKVNKQLDSDASGLTSRSRSTCSSQRKMKRISRKKDAHNKHDRESKFMTFT